MGTSLQHHDRAAPPAAVLPDPSFFRVATILLRSRHLIMIGATVAPLVLFTVASIAHRRFTSVTAFVPQSDVQSRLSGLSGLAAQFGLGNLAQGASTFGTPEFYKALLETRDILGALADTRFSAERDGEPFEGTLEEFWRTKGTTPARRRESVMKKLKGRMNVKVDPRTQLVTLEVTTISATLSKAIVDRALELVSQFNQERRQSQSGKERTFLGSRLDEARRELRDAEDSVARFMERNRDFRNSPPMVFQYDRLQREVTLRQTLYSTLTQSFEQSRIEEVRDTPVLTVVETPSLPPRPDSRHLALKLPLALIAGALLGALGALAQDFFTRATPEQTDVAEFGRLVWQLQRDLWRPWRLFRADRV